MGDRHPRTPRTTPGGIFAERSYPDRKQTEIAVLELAFFQYWRNGGP
jgi:hypothetical protein